MSRPAVAFFDVSVLLLLVAAGLLVLSGCDDAAPGEPVREQFLPSFDALEAGWNVLLPAGETTCARGGEYAFFVWPGDRERVLINFAGGASCWKTSNCSEALAIFPEDVAGNRAAIASGATFPGIFDMANAGNPFSGWTQVVVAYCTGDHHLGNVERAYDGGFSVRHRGAVNTDAVLDWVERELPMPDQVAVAGCSGGGYGAPLWLPQLRARFPAATTTLYVDSAAGGLPGAVIEAQGDAWDAWAMYPRDIAGLDPDAVARGSLDQEVILAALAAHFPEVRFAIVNSAEDQAQTDLDAEAGGSGEWSARMRASVERLAAAASNLEVLVVPGTVHCLLFDAAFYTASGEEGTALTAWLAERVAP